VRLKCQIIRGRRVEQQSLPNMCSTRLVQRRKHWWNGRWGRLARMDVLVFEDGGRWWVEAREGGVEGRSRWLECADQDGADDYVRILLAGRDDWRELP
jgi:hypothetical protein